MGSRLDLLKVCAACAAFVTAAKADETTTTTYSNNGNTVVITQQSTTGEAPKVKVETRDGFVAIEQKGGRNRAVVIQRRAPW